MLSSSRKHHKPGTHVASSPHEGPQGEPQTVQQGEVVCEGQTPLVTRLLNLPLVWRESTHKEENQTHSEVRNDDAVPGSIIYLFKNNFNLSFF